MAQNPVNPTMPADLPTNWTYGQTVAPTGAEAGLDEKHGYNYLMQQVNAAQAMINKVGAAIAALTAADVQAVPNTRTVNGKALSADVTLSAADVKARPATWTPTAADVGARPNTWTPTAADVGARPDTWMPTAAQVGALPDATVPIAKGGTGATAAASAIYNLVNALTALASTGLATGDYLPLLDASAGTGKKVTLTNLKTWLQNQGIGARIATGSYTGTGTYGADNPCTLTFNFSPLFFAVVSNGGNAYTAITTVLFWLYSSDVAAIWNVSSSNGSAGIAMIQQGNPKTSVDNNSIHLYLTQNNASSANTNGETYYYLAIG